MFDKSLIQGFYEYLPHANPAQVGPDIVTLSRKTQFGDPDTFAAGVRVPARRHPATAEEVLNAGLIMAPNLIKFSLFDDGSITNYPIPKDGDKLTDSAGNSFNILSVKATCLESLYACICSQMNVPG
jgi:hypothetical protein